jgi:hypothetical protein
MFVSPRFRSHMPMLRVVAQRLGEALAGCSTEALSVIPLVRSLGNLTSGRSRCSVLRVF